MMENEKETQFWKRILLFSIAVFLLMFVYQYIYVTFFKPSETKKEVASQQTKEKKSPTLEKVEIPQLMLGTFREKQEYDEKVQADLGIFSLEISQKGGKILRLIDKKYGYDLISSAERQLKIFPLEIFTGNPDLDTKINFGEYEVIKEKDLVVLKHKELNFEKVLKYENYAIKLEVRGLNPPFWVFVGTYPDDEAFYTHEGPIIHLNGQLDRLDVKDLKGVNEFSGKITLAGEESRYFFKGAKGDFEKVLIYKVKVGENWRSFTALLYTQPITLYYGAKDYARLRVLGLEDLIDWGTLKVIVKPLFIFLYWIYEHTGSWVISIVVLTLITRIFMFPLGYKSTVSMLKLQELAPKLEKLKQKYKDDPVKLQEEMMKLYAEAGFNPFSGCLPILLQIPIFFALYKVLIITVDLKVSSFLWIPSLADKDPFYLLPIIMGLTMILQQKLTPSPDPKQALTGYLMSVIFTLLFINFPAGLVLYWTLNNVLNIVQNYLIKEVLLKDKINQSNKTEGRSK